jgi:hypothetical protein
MNNSEKCYYAVIGNKKRGKFSGVGPIQVAKKVASKKLKAGKEIEFYLDEVAGKKKRLGPYQARKDKKSGRVAVVKARKVMKGGVLSESDKVKLKQFFDNINNDREKQLLLSRLQKNSLKDIYTKSRLPIISFYREPIVFFNVIRTVLNTNIYTLAAFKERIGNIYIMIYIIINRNETKIDIVSMTEFFLNPYYSYCLNELYYNNKNNQYQTRKFVDNNFNNSSNNQSEIGKLDFKDILISLQKPENNNSRTIREEAIKIYELLYVPTNDKKQTAMIYVPNYYQPRIKKCVYSNLTFGVLDEETVNERISQEMIKSKIPESFYQLYLIKRQSFFNGYYEPVIYIQLPLPLENIKLFEEYKYFIKYNKNLNKKINSRIINEANKNNPYFNYCIYTDPTDRKRLKIIINNSNFISTSDFNEKLSNDNNIKIACSILLTIPQNKEFGELQLQRVRRIANNIINPPQFVWSQGRNNLRQPFRASNI